MSSETGSYKVPIWCPYCKQMMKGKSTQTFYRYGCCVHCSIEFIEDREDRWRSGWRPSEADIEAFLKKLSVAE